MKNLNKLLSFVLLLGTIWAFYSVFQEFSAFYRLEGTIFKIEDCLIPNPVTTPCFYGAFGFLIALIWSWRILKFDELKKKLHNKYLGIFLFAGSTFAWFNAGSDLIEYYGLEDRAAGIIGCSGGVVHNPFTTPCFIGASLFLLSFLVSLVNIYLSRNKNY